MLIRCLMLLVLLGAAGCEEIFLAGRDGQPAPGADNGAAPSIDTCDGGPGADRTIGVPGGEAGSATGGAEAGQGNGGGSPAAGGALAMKRTPIGAPTWRPECAHAFAAPCGSKAQSFSLAPVTIQKVLPAHHYFPARNVVGPGTVHGSFADEIPQGLKAAGLAASSSFSVAELAAPSCVFVLVQLVPGAGAPTGPSVELPAGPLLDPKAFPLLIDGSLSLAGQIVDGALDFEYPAKQALSPEPPGQSYSHVPLVFFENSELIQAKPGAYTLELRILDALGKGWSISAGYTITP